MNEEVEVRPLGKVEFYCELWAVYEGDDEIALCTEKTDAERIAALLRGEAE